MTMASGVFGETFDKMFEGTITAIDVAGAGHEFVLVTDTHTPNFDTHTNDGDITNEISGTLGDYTSGGEAFTSPTSAASSGLYTCGAANDSLTGMTVTGIRGRVCFDDLSTGVVDALTFATTFGADFNVTAGTLTIDNSAGLFTIDYTP